MDKEIKVHFIGIGGVGMSALAELFYRYGYHVQGSDIKKSKFTDRLESMGIHVETLHYAKNIKDVDYVVYSSCIGEVNVELKEARRRRIPVFRRIEALNILMGDKKIIAISGAHGKTTTTALVSYLLLEGGLDPTVLIGADVYFLGGNVHCGRSNIVVTEADESDGSFLLLRPLYSISTNIDKEHLDYYLKVEKIIEAYRNFTENTKDEGCVFLCVDDPNLRVVANNSSKRIMTYGFSEDADIKAENVEFLGIEGSDFDLTFKGRVLGRLHLSIIGMHNVLNSLAAIGLALELGIDFSVIKDTIGDFGGAERRFTVTHLDSDILVIDDYAHHPTEIRATLKVLEGSGKRIVVVFQPHRYSRTRYLRKEFGASFELADHLVITDIYSAYEKDIGGVSARDICKNAKKYGHKDVHFVSKDDIVGHLKKFVMPGDAVFILGAGDIGDLSGTIVREIASSLSASR